MPWAALASAIVGLAVAFEIFTGTISDRLFADQVPSHRAAASAADTSWLESAALAIYRTICPLFTDCESREENSRPNTSSQNASRDHTSGESQATQAAKTSPPNQPEIPSRNTPEKSQTPSPNPSQSESAVGARALTILYQNPQQGEDTSDIEARLTLLEETLNTLSSRSARQTNATYDSFDNSFDSLRDDYATSLDTGALAADTLAVTGDTTLASLSAGSTTLQDLTAQDTTLASLLVSGDVSIDGTLTAASLSVAGVSSGGAISAPYFNATSTTATSTFEGGLTAGMLTVDALTGYVGIGTSTPSKPFSVLGNAYIKGDLQVNGNTRISEHGELTVGDKVISEGEIGVGTSSPYAKLGIQSTTVATTSLAAWGIAGQTAPLFDVWSNPTSNQNYFRITSSGNVGIGTTTPAALLSVAGSIYADGPTLTLGKGGSGTGGNIKLISDDGSTRWAVGLIPAVSPTAFNIYDNISSLPAITVRAGNNVGIGETAPGSKLSVSGGATIGASYDTTAAPTSGLLIEGSVGIGTTSPGAKLAVHGSIFANGNLTAANITATGTGYFAGNVGIGTQPSSSGAGQLYTSGPANFNYPGSNLGNTNIDASGTGGAARVFGYSGAAALNFMLNANGDSWLNGGSVGIGTTTPGSKLTVNGDSTSAVAFTKTNGSMAFNFDTTNSRLKVIGTTPYLQFIDGANASSQIKQSGAALQFLVNDGSVTGMHITQLGNLGIGTTNPGQKLTVAGSVGFPAIVNDAGTAYLCITLATGVISTSTSACNPSSLRFKDNVADLSYGLDDLLRIHPVSFTYKPELLVEGAQIGFIAEELAEIVPEAVGYDKEGKPYNVDYGKLTPVIIGAIKELYTFVMERFAGQDEEIEALKQRILELESRSGVGSTSDDEPQEGSGEDNEPEPSDNENDESDTASSTDPIVINEDDELVGLDDGAPQDGEEEDEEEHFIGPVPSAPGASEGEPNHPSI